MPELPLTYATARRTWIVRGVHRPTGRAVAIPIEAATEEEAIKAAGPQVAIEGLAAHRRQPEHATGPRRSWPALLRLVGFNALMMLITILAAVQFFAALIQRHAGRPGLSFVSAPGAPGTFIPTVHYTYSAAFGAAEVSLALIALLLALIAWIGLTPLIAGDRYPPGRA